MPNAENCTLEELEIAAKAAPSRGTYDRLMGIKALVLGLAHDQVAALFAVDDDTVSRWVRHFMLILENNVGLKIFANYRPR